MKSGSILEDILGEIKGHKKIISLGEKTSVHFLGTEMLQGVLTMIRLIHFIFRQFILMKTRNGKISLVDIANNFNKISILKRLMYVLPNLILKK